MKERIQQLLDLEHLTPSKFADIIGVQRSSVSHVLSGRNNPSFDFLEKTLKAFPGLKADWLMLGQGPMYEKMGREMFGELFEKAEDTAVNQQETIEEPEDSGSFEDEPPDESEKDKESDEKHAEKGITQVMILYDDDTFTVFRPSQ